MEGCEGGQRTLIYTLGDLSRGGLHFRLRFDDRRRSLVSYLRFFFLSFFLLPLCRSLFSRFRREFSGEARAFWFTILEHLEAAERKGGERSRGEEMERSGEGGEKEKRGRLFCSFRVNFDSRLVTTLNLRRIGIYRLRETRGSCRILYLNVFRSPSAMDKRAKLWRRRGTIG